MATSKEKFDAAVNVIHSLPKNGPFQPSYEMMLTFYGLYKQASEGKCTKPKPWSWDIVAKKKWDAWSKLGDMAQEEAMDLYVEELKKSISSSTDKWNSMGQNDKRIVEAMPQEKPVRDFMDVIGSFYELIEEKTPFAGNPDYESRVVQRGVLKNNPEVERDIVLNGVREFPESMDEEFTNYDNETSALSILDTEKEQWENRPRNTAETTNYEIHDTESSRTERLPSGDTVYDNIQHDTVEEVHKSSRGQIESESDDEFCDSFDQPSPDKVINEIHHINTNSDDNSAKPNQKKKNQVHFTGNSSLKSDVEINSNVISEAGEAEKLFSTQNLHSKNNIYNHSESESQECLESDSMNHQVGYQSLLVGGNRAMSQKSVGLQPDMDHRSIQAGPEVNSQILTTLLKIQQDISDVLTRLDRLEAVKKKENPKWWPFPFQFPGKQMLFLVIWPVILYWFFNRRRKRSIR